MAQLRKQTALARKLSKSSATDRDYHGLYLIWREWIYATFKNSASIQELIDQVEEAADATQDEEAHLTFEGKSDGEIAFGALKGFLDVRYGARDGSACAEFSWEGHDENDPACGRGWVMIDTAGKDQSPSLRTCWAQTAARKFHNMRVECRSVLGRMLH
jgi:hypothetical protein